MTGGIPRGEIIGVVEHPAPGSGPVAGQTLLVSGWVLASAGLQRLSLFGAAGEVATMLTGQARPDVAEIFPDLPQAAQAGFAGLLDLTGLAHGRHRLTLEAVDADGAAQRWQFEIELISRAAEYADWRARTAASRLRLPGSLALDRLAHDVTVSVVVNVERAGQAEGLWRTLQSIDAQNHRAAEVLVRWTLDPLPRPVARGLKVVVGTLADVLRGCQGRLVTVVDAGELLLYRALDIVVRNHLAHPQAGLLYADHEQQDAPGERRPVFKPAWSPVLFEQLDYIAHPWVAQREVLASALGASLADPDDEHALVARSAAQSACVGHIPAILLTRPTRPMKPQPVRHGPGATEAGITVVVPTRLTDREILVRCLDGLAATRRNCPGLQVLVVLNNLTTPLEEALRFLAAWDVEPLLFEGPFNWSALNNAAARHGRGELLLFLNDDVEPVDADWLGRMARLALRSEVGAVGALLRYPNRRIQHAGVHITAGSRIDCRHTYRTCRGDEPELQGLLAHDREQTAVTGACLLTRREVFDAVGGFDERLVLVFNDVDYCLRLAEQGYVCLQAGGAELIHHEGLSRAGMPEDEDFRCFSERWLGSLPATDPFYNPALKQLCDDWSLDPHTPLAPKARLMPGRVSIRKPMSTDLAWKQWGDKDPYYGVITDERYRSRNMTEADRHTFFESGRMHVEHVLATCAAQRQAAFRPTRVLDFGCGVGRLVVPFAQRVEQVVGIDISEGMLAEARRNCDQQGLRNVTLLLSDDQLSALDGSFDLIHAAIVFQHIDVPRGRELFRRLLQHLSPHGMAAVHFTYAKQVHADNWGWPPEPTGLSGLAQAMPKPRRLRSLLPFGPGAKASTEDAGTGPVGGDPEMQMNCYRLNEVFFLIQQSGATSMRCEFTDHGGELGVVLYFQRG